MCSNLGIQFLRRASPNRTTPHGGCELGVCVCVSASQHWTVREDVCCAVKTRFPRGTQFLLYNLLENTDLFFSSRWFVFRPRDWEGRLKGVTRRPCHCCRLFPPSLPTEHNTPVNTFQLTFKSFHDDFIHHDHVTWGTAASIQITVLVLKRSFSRKNVFDTADNWSMITWPEALRPRFR